VRGEKSKDPKINSDDGQLIVHVQFHHLLFALDRNIQSFGGVFIPTTKLARVQKLDLKEVQLL